VIGPVTVAVHLNVNPTLIVIRPVDPLRCPLVDGRDHLHGVATVHVHGHDHGVDHDHAHVDDLELHPTCDQWSDVHGHDHDHAHIHVHEIAPDL